MGGPRLSQYAGWALFARGSASEELQQGACNVPLCAASLTPAGFRGCPRPSCEVRGVGTRFLLRLCCPQRCGGTQAGCAGDQCRPPRRQPHWSVRL